MFCGALKHLSALCFVSTWVWMSWVPGWTPGWLDNLLHVINAILRNCLLPIQVFSVLKLLNFYIYMLPKAESRCQFTWHQEASLQTVAPSFISTEMKSFWTFWNAAVSRSKTWGWKQTKPFSCGGAGITPLRKQRFKNSSICSVSERVLLCPPPPPPPLLKLSDYQAPWMLVADAVAVLVARWPSVKPTQRPACRFKASLSSLRRWDMKAALSNMSSLRDHRGKWPERISNTNKSNNCIFFCF